MYNPPGFAVTDPATLRDAVRAIALAELITVGSGGIEASMVPLLVSDDARVLRGHLARANPQWANADPSEPVLVCWHGPQSYVSPSFYPSKAEHGEVVPTWNYILVQARGSLIVHDDASWVREVVKALTDVHESASVEPWRLEDAPPSYVDAMLKGVVGVEIMVTSLQGKWKLSQNRPPRDFEGVLAGLESRQQPSGAGGVASAMRSLNATVRRVAGGLGCDDEDAAASSSRWPLAGGASEALGGGRST